MHVLCSLVLFASAACASADGTDELWRGGRVYAHAASAPGDDLHIRAGRVAAPETSWRSAQVHELAGACVIPGFIDAHAHLEGLGAKLEELDLVGCGSYAELVERTAARAGNLPPGAWILGRGWDQTLWSGSEFPTHELLSAAVPDHPVLLERVDGHAVLANLAALERAGIASAREIAGGRVLVDESGRPTGVLVDAAADLVARLVPAPDRETRARRLLAAQARLFSLGITSVHDMGLAPGALEILSELEDDGLWKLRVVGYVAANEGVSAEARRFLARARANPMERRVRLVGAKLMIDGAMGSRGAALLEDYADAPGERGHLLLDEETFRARLDEVADLGLQPATHAIGDRANRIVLDAYEARLRRDPGFAALLPRIEHAQLVAESDWPRFAHLGVVASMQPTHATSDMRWAEARVGPERLRGAYAWRTLAEDPSLLAFGSDVPVEDPDPLRGLYAARTRTDAQGEPRGGWRAQECLSAEEALAAFTSGAARAGHQSVGRLEAGAPADFVVLDLDPLTCSSTELLSARVLATVVEGEIVYSPR